jgi:hypothetical protein
VVSHDHDTLTCCATASSRLDIELGIRLKSLKATDNAEGRRPVILECDPNEWTCIHPRAIMLLVCSRYLGSWTYDGTVLPVDRPRGCGAIAKGSYPACALTLSLINTLCTNPGQALEESCTSKYLPYNSS